MQKYFRARDLTSLIQRGFKKICYLFHNVSSEDIMETVLLYTLSVSLSVPWQVHRPGSCGERSGDQSGPAGQEPRHLPRPMREENLPITGPRRDHHEEVSTMTTTLVSQAVHKIGSQNYNEMLKTFENIKSFSRTYIKLFPPIIFCKKEETVKL